MSIFGQSRVRTAQPALLLTFAFAVMADPVWSVAYAIEAALRALHGNLGLLLPTMGMVIGIVALVTISYHQVVARFPQGGGAAAAVGEAFGKGWSFVPVGALVVDFALTIAVSAAAATAAIIAYLPLLAPWDPAGSPGGARGGRRVLVRTSRPCGVRGHDHRIRDP